MISIGSFIHDKSHDDSLLRLSVSLLEALGEHAAQSGAAQKKEFQADCRRFVRNLRNAKTPADQAAVGNQAIQALQHYNSEAGSRIATSTAEMKATLELMTKALLRISSHSDAAAANIRNITTELLRTSETTDLQRLKTGLSVLLEGLCKEAERHEAQAESLRQQFDQLQRAASGERNTIPPPPDGTFAHKREALRYFAELNELHTDFYVVVLRMERLLTINTRFGYARGNQAVHCFGTHVAQRLQPDDRLFHWSGPCLVAVLRRGSSFQSMRAEAARIAGIRPEFSIEIGSRLVMLNLSAAWSVLPGKDEARPLAARIEDVINEQQKSAPLTAPSFRALAGEVA